MQVESTVAVACESTPKFDRDMRFPFAPARLRFDDSMSEQSIQTIAVIAIVRYESPVPKPGTRRPPWMAEVPQMQDAICGCRVQGDPARRRRRYMRSGAAIPN